MTTPNPLYVFRPDPEDNQYLLVGYIGAELRYRRADLASLLPANDPADDALTDAERAIITTLRASRPRTLAELIMLGL